ncbi:NAD(P)-dependent oxidoreductase [Microbacterium esteraromaticum]|nr:NAD(P)-dependent oxidoreductase [Microbacterium esteraromaticum]
MNDDTRNQAKRLLVTSGVARLDRRHLEQFSEAGFELDLRYELSGIRDEETLVDALDGAWGVIAGTEHYTRAVLERSPGLRVIARCGVGYDAIDVDAADDLGTVVTTTPGANDESVAEFAVALAVALLGRAAPARRLADETVAVIGLGAIGMGVARRFAGFGSRVLGVDPWADPAACRAEGIELTGMPAALAAAGVISLHVPLSSATAGLIGAEQLALMPPDSLLVNTARGEIVDEGALLDALRSGSIGGAALDVFLDEPLPPGHPIREVSSTILTGHIAGMTQASVMAMLDDTLAHLLRIRAGMLPRRGVVNRRLPAKGAPSATTTADL